MKGSIAVIKSPPAIPMATALNIEDLIFEAIMKITKAAKTRPIVTLSLRKGTLSTKFSTIPIINGVTRIAEPIAMISGDVRNF